MLSANVYSHKWYMSAVKKCKAVSWLERNLQSHIFYKNPVIRQFFRVSEKASMKEAQKVSIPGSVSEVVFLLLFWFISSQKLFKNVYHIQSITWSVKTSQNFNRFMAPAGILDFETCTRWSFVIEPVVMVHIGRWGRYYISHSLVCSMGDKDYHFPSSRVLHLRK